MSVRQLPFGASIHRRHPLLGIAFLAVTAVINWGPANAETIGGAIAKAYLNNPDINQQRAGVRASDENIPKANAGFLPTVNGQASDSFSDILASLAQMA
jgi:outer membrane protein